MRSPSKWETLAVWAVWAAGALFCALVWAGILNLLLIWVEP